MKRIIASIIFLGLITAAECQLSPEAVFEKYSLAKTQDEKTILLNAVFNDMAKGTFSERVAALVEMEEHFKSKKDKWGTGYMQLGIQNGYRIMGRYDSSIRYALRAVNNFEDINDTASLITSLAQVGHTFSESQNFRLALTYYLKGKDYSLNSSDRTMYAELLDYIAGSYNSLNLPDSALPPVSEALGVALRLNDSSLSAAYYARIGETYLKKREPNSARYYFLKSLEINNHFTTSYYTGIYNELAESFYMQQAIDSSLYYAYLAVEYGYPEFKKQLMTGYQWLYKNFELRGETDSVNKYYRLCMDLKDTLFKTETNTAIVLQNFDEQMREDKLAADKLKEAAERRENLEYALISLVIVVATGLFLLLTRRFTINEKVIKAFGVVTLLIVFEFFNLLLHPWLEKITHHSPVLMLVALVVLAAGIAPLHHKAEKWAIAKLIEKNKGVQIAA